ncbi:MAG: hypothetical protein ACK4E7_04415 [Permianibacter sp.]
MRVATIAMFSMMVSFAYADDVNNVKIKRWVLKRSYGERLFIQLHARQTLPLECHSNGGWEYVLDTSDEPGKQLYSALLSAYASGKTLQLRGQNKCTLWSNVEDLDGAILR